MSTVRKPRVLVVEDDPTLQKVVRTNLERMSIDVTVASDGSEALKLLEADPPNLVCTDLMLPVLSGFDLCAHMQKTAALQDIPIIVMSARTLPQDRARALDLGAQAYFTKPFKPSALREKVEELLSLSKAAPAP